MGQAMAAPAVEADYGAVRSRATAERRLFERYRNHDDVSAREELAERFLPLARKLAMRFAWRREQLDDLVQVASLGLVKAIDRFDHERGVAFSSFAVPTILGELKRHLRDTGWALHVPQRIQQRTLEVERATEALRITLGRSPTAEEVAEHTGLSTPCVAEAVEATSALQTVSLDWERENGSGPGADHSALLAFDDERYEAVEQGAMLQPALAALPARERLLLLLRFELDMTQAEIAAQVGMSQMHVSRLLRRALSRMRAVAFAHQMN